MRNLAWTFWKKRLKLNSFEFLWIEGMYTEWMLGRRVRWQFDIVHELRKLVFMSRFLLVTPSCADRKLASIDSLTYSSVSKNCCLENSSLTYSTRDWNLRSSPRDEWFNCRHESTLRFLRFLLAVELWSRKKVEDMKANVWSRRVFFCDVFIGNAEVSSPPIWLLNHPQWMC